MQKNCPLILNIFVLLKAFTSHERTMPINIYLQQKRGREGVGINIVFTLNSFSCNTNTKINFCFIDFIYTNINIKLCIFKIQRQLRSRCVHCVPNKKMQHIWIFSIHRKHRHYKCD